MTLIDSLPQLKTLWTAWFFLMFGAILLWTLWPSRRRSLQEHARIPLDDGNPAGDSRHGR